DVGCVGESLFLLFAGAAIQRGASFGAPAQQLRRQHHAAVDDEERGGGVGAGEQRLDSALEKDSEHGRRQRPGHQEHRKALRVGGDAAANRGGEEAANDRHPLRSVEDEQRDRRPDVQEHKKWEKRRIGLLEAPMQEARDAAVLLAAYAAATQWVRLGTGVLPIYTRHPTAMAQMAATLDELSAGRFILGIGVSHKITVEAMWGLKLEHPADAMREYLSI